MRLAVMQPYFFPYLGYFALLDYVDNFILLDQVQFIKGGWIERNRILSPAGGWQYIRVPLVKSPHGTPISDKKIRDEPWKKKLLAQLAHYKRQAPFYSETMDVVRKGLEIETDNIVRLNQNTLKAVCDYLEIDTPIQILSEMELEIQEPNAADEWSLNIAKAIGATEYVNPPGGRSFFDPAKYEEEGITLKFLEINLHEYDQKRDAFEPGLSIIDVLMFNSPEEIGSQLRDCKLHR